MNIRKFWGDFSANAAEWAVRFVEEHDAEGVFADVDKVFEKRGLQYCFDITAEDGTCLLIFSPEGNRIEAAEIDKIVGAVPAIPGWRILGRRQKKDLSDVAAFMRNMYLVELSECRFAFVDDVVEIFVPTPCDMTPPEQVGFANTLLWHALGEAYVMEHGIHSGVMIGIPTEKTLSAEEFVKQCLTRYR